MTELSKSPTSLDRAEQAAKILGLIAVPLLVAYFGTSIQRQIASENLGRDYVQIAIGILKEEKKPGDEPLRGWAIDLLNANSPNAKLDAAAAEQLRTGRFRIPISIYDFTAPKGTEYRGTHSDAEQAMPKNPITPPTPAK